MGWLAQGDHKKAPGGQRTEAGWMVARSIALDFFAVWFDPGFFILFRDLLIKGRVGNGLETKVEEATLIT